jgi:hypothetical protein
VKMPPSAPTRHAPLPLGVAAMPTMGALSDSAVIDADAIGAVAAWAPEAGSTVAVAAMVTSATLMRAFHPCACRRWCTIALPLAGAPKLGCPTFKGSAGFCAGFRRGKVPLSARVLDFPPGFQGPGRAPVLDDVPGLDVVVSGTVVEVCGAVVDGLGTVVGGAGRVPTRT